MRSLAEIFEGVDAETAYGGRSVSWEPRGWAWLKMGVRRRRERSGPDGLQVVETVTAETRADQRLAPGAMLRLSGADWRILTAETVGGLAILRLERMR